MKEKLKHGSYMKLQSEQFPCQQNVVRYTALRRAGATGRFWSTALWPEAYHKGLTQ